MLTGLVLLLLRGLLLRSFENRNERILWDGALGWCHDAVLVGAITGSSCATSHGGSLHGNDARAGRLFRSCLLLTLVVLSIFAVTLVI